LAIFRIDGELEVAALGATLLLAGRIGARGLLRVKSGWLELPVAKTATPLIHPFTVTAHSIQLPEMDSADCSAGAPDLVAAECLSLRNISTGKETTLQFFMVLQVRDPPIGRLTIPHRAPKVSTHVNPVYY
jgi:hypothetical protein